MIRYKWRCDARKMEEEGRVAVRGVESKEVSANEGTQCSMVR